jgi:pimeloyl-ACP methyl ester carboxylesterase
MVSKMGQYVMAGNVRMYYEEHGEGEPLLLMHGGCCTIETLYGLTLYKELANRYRVILPERRGHGRTADVEGPISYDLMAQDTIAFMEATGVISAHLVGYSDGACVGILVAMSRPDLVKKFVSISGSFDVNGGTKEWMAFAQSATPETVEHHPTLAKLVELYKQTTPDGPEHFSIVFEKIKRMWQEEPKIPPQNLSRITAPTLIMAGDRDLVTLEHTIELFRAIPKAQLCIVPGSSHGLVVEKPRVVAQAILDFLADERRRNIFLGIQA